MLLTDKNTQDDQFEEIKNTTQRLTDLSAENFSLKMDIVSLKSEILFLRKVGELDSNHHKSLRRILKGGK